MFVVDGESATSLPPLDHGRTVKTTLTTLEELPLGRQG